MKDFKKINKARKKTQDAITKAIENGFEVCICAANKFEDRIWLGHRHMYSMDAQRQELSYLMTGKEMMEKDVSRISGFLTNKNRFVDRDEGLELQLAAGIPSAAKGHGDDYRGMLFSEDLY